MRYASIRSMDISNGERVGVSLFVQGCHFHCRNCFNQSTWDFNGGKEWTEEAEDNFFKLINRPYIKRVSILGGEPLADENVSEVLKICKKFRLLFGQQKSIWLYSGYEWKTIFDYKTPFTKLAGTPNDEILYDYHMFLRKQIISQCDVMVDGRYVDELKDQSYPYAGSTNQHVIDVRKSLGRQQPILWKSEVSL